MKKTIVMPEVSNDATEVEIAQWFVKVGDEVKTGDPLLEVLVEKVDIQIDVEESGKIIEIKEEEGAVVEIGDEIAVIKNK